MNKHFQKKRTRICPQCGIAYDSIDFPHPFCEDCAKAMGLILKRHFPESDLPGWTMDEKNAKARELGLSYGQFAALVHDGTLVLTNNDKPQKLSGNGQTVVRHVKIYSNRG